MHNQLYITVGVHNLGVMIAHIVAIDDFVRCKYCKFWTNLSSRGIWLSKLQIVLLFFPLFNHLKWVLLISPLENCWDDHGLGNSWHPRLIYLIIGSLGSSNPIECGSIRPRSLSERRCFLFVHLFNFRTSSMSFHYQFHCPFWYRSLVYDRWIARATGRSWPRDAA